MDTASPGNTSPLSGSDLSAGPSTWLGVDTGGTFTDFVLVQPGKEVRIHKVLSTPQAPEQAILQGIDALHLRPLLESGQLQLVHGTTVATNAALEGKGARTLFITNHGFEDLLLIGRQTRRELYQLQPTDVFQPVDRALCLGVSGRIGADGKVVAPLSDANLETMVAQVRELKPEAIAICTLFSYLNPVHEQTIRDRLAECADFVCASSDLLPISGEFERGMATWLNAWLGPKVANYMARLQQHTRPANVSIMQSHGGTLSIDQAGRNAVNLLLSGPAGGLAATGLLQAHLDESDFITFDMGGTSSDVALVQGTANITLEGQINQLPVAVPMVEMHTIGAGGGSLAQVDGAGMLHVGPQSAGADPGPACYGRGGGQVTVTDANLVLGRLQPAFALGGSMQLDAEAAGQAMDRLADAMGLDRQQAALGVLQLANEHMAQALRVISIQKGHRPADFRLVSFGGAGGLHVCALAESLGMHKAVVPAHSGVLSALGMLLAPRQIEQVESLEPHAGSDKHLLEKQIRERLQSQINSAKEQLIQEGIAQEDLQQDYKVEMRYQGQSFTLAIDWPDDTTGNNGQAIDQCTQAFHKAHARRYGHQLDMPVEFARLRTRVYRPSPLDLPTSSSGTGATAWMNAKVTGDNNAILEAAVYHREEMNPGQCVDGPALITEAVATTWIPPGWQGCLHQAGHLLLDKIKC